MEVLCYFWGLLGVSCPGHLRALLADQALLISCVRTFQREAVRGTGCPSTQGLVKLRHGGYSLNPDRRQKRSRVSAWPEWRPLETFVVMATASPGGGLGCPLDLCSLLLGRGVRAAPRLPGRTGRGRAGGEPLPRGPGWCEPAVRARAWSPRCLSLCSPHLTP